MDRWRGRVAIVTGASVGIGAAIAKDLVHHGMKVIGCARSVDNIEKLADECKAAGYSGVLVPYRCDLSNEEEIMSMFSAIQSQHQGVDVCINNAGLARPESLLGGKTTGWRNMVNVNVIALAVCTREAYQSMKARNVDDGHIININSMSGHRVVQSRDTHFYSATKYAVTALTEGLRQELREAKTHIRATYIYIWPDLKIDQAGPFILPIGLVNLPYLSMNHMDVHTQLNQCISPGFVETEFAFRLHDENPEKAATTYTTMKCLEAKDIVDAVTYVLSAPSHVQIGDIHMRPVKQIT